MIRHTCPAIDKGICYGQSDLELAASFEEEKKAVLKLLPSAIDRVYTSPLKRCVQLAEGIAGAGRTGKIVQDDRLKELHFGKWEMQKWDEIPRKELDMWGNNFLTAVVPGGESFQDLKKRLGEFWEETKRLQKGKRIGIVTHHGIIQALLLLEHTIEEKQLFSRKIPYGGVLRIEVHGCSNGTEKK